MSRKSFSIVPYLEGGWIETKLDDISYWPVYTKGNPVRWQIMFAGWQQGADGYWHLYHKGALFSSGSLKQMLDLADSY